MSFGGAMAGGIGSHFPHGPQTPLLTDPPPLSMCERDGRFNTVRNSWDAAVSQWQTYTGDISLSKERDKTVQMRERERERATKRVGREREKGRQGEQETARQRARQRAVASQANITFTGEGSVNTNGGYWGLGGQRWNTVSEKEGLHSTHKDTFNTMSWAIYRGLPKHR